MLDAAGVEWVDVDDLPRLKQSYGKFRTPCDQTLTLLADPRTVSPRKVMMNDY
jgi:hypothetical protein